MSAPIINKPPMRGNPIPQQTTMNMKATVSFGKPQKGDGYRVCLYGTGGIGKTTLAAKAPSPAFIDLDKSLGKLNIDAPVVNGVHTWAELRALLQGDGWGDIKTIVLDTGSRAEDLAIEHTLMTVKHEKGRSCTSIEDYGYGKGYSHVYDTFMGLLADLDRHTSQGRNVIIICHDCIKLVPNPAGDDWQRYEPRLQDPTTQKNSIKLRLKEWCDHVLFIGYDVEAKNKKGVGCGTRTIWRAEYPHCMAKARGDTSAYVIEQDCANGVEFWANCGLK